ncbi:adenine phosphoribosyltransferase [Candidatus Aerophobetes bacterium]|uniref:Adenine phosphoribosyltransferase n=1 Tax=Aerophobetes bacterium TaxID=2030807 RepID=A0A7V5HYK9_UNCAE|nr:adenine phosphoribosyltransferase [Candidatus Aerophobetes bacterium]HHF98328.1 adenine phosphoribosyltransferase [Candidatus Aerophobetes bacterium]
MREEVVDELAGKIRDIKDFPKKGIIFRDITPLLKDAVSFKKAVNLIADNYRQKNIDYVVSPEARGFILGAAVAYELGVGFIPVRKPGKLPYKVESVTYSLEYGEDEVQIHQDAVKEGDSVLVFDDVIATGGTAKACCRLIEKLGGKVVGVCFLIELTDLKGRENLAGYDVFSIIKY